MPVEFERSARAIARRRGYGKRRTAAYVYGGMRHRLGWMPSTQKKKVAGKSVARRRRLFFFGGSIRRHRRGKHAGGLFHSHRAARKVPVLTHHRHKQTEEEKRAHRRAYYHAHKAEINRKRREKKPLKLHTARYSTMPYGGHRKARQRRSLASQAQFI